MLNDSLRLPKSKRSLKNMISIKHPAAMLDTLSEKAVQPKINPIHVAYCPTMDLIALATIDEKVHVFRFNGQKVFGITSKDPLAKINQIIWKPNGESDILSNNGPHLHVAGLRLNPILGLLLAVAFSNNFVYLTNAHTGKLMHQIDFTAHANSQICCLGWGVNSGDVFTLRTTFEKVDGEVGLYDLLDQRNKGVKSHLPSDLPGDLAVLDIEQVLPRLSPLSSGGKE